MKLPIWLTIWPWTDPRQAISYFASSTPPSPSAGTNQVIYRVDVEVPDPIPTLIGEATQVDPKP